MQKSKLANTLFLGGTGLIVLGLVFSFSYFLPYFVTQFYASTIPTAPSLTPSNTATPSNIVILPFADEDLSKIPTRDVNWGILPTVTATPAIAIATPTAPPPPTATTVWVGVAPTHLRIPTIELDAPIVPISWKTTEVNGVDQAIWDVPDWHAAGWHNTSARIGIAGNTVLNGHNTTKGEVFRYLYTLELGSLIQVDTDAEETYTYKVEEKYILPEAGQPLEVRIQNAQYILPTQDERLTLVTCHPYGSLANRLLIIAYPVPASESISREGE
jgi:LPXTG-site transpeptidase (sortase) family protein